MKLSRDNYSVKFDRVSKLSRDNKRLSKEPHLIESNLIECPYVERITDGKVLRIRMGAGLCQLCERDSCQFKPKTRKPKRSRARTCRPGTT